MTALTALTAKSPPAIREALPHLLFLLLLALIIYQPWASVPFPMVDYSEFLRPFQQGGSFFAGLQNVIEYYRSHGRSSYLAYLQLAVNWAVFGERPVGWNIAVFAYMAAALTAVWLLLVRLGNTRLAATIATTLLIVTTPAVPVWLRPTGEPLVLAFVAIALMIALSFQQSERWRTHAVVLTLLFLGIGLAKDLLTPLMALPFVVACCWHPGIRVPRPSARNAWLLAGTLVAGITLAFSIWFALSHRGPDAYTEGYRSTNLSPAGFIGIFWTELLPYTRSASTERVSVAHMFANAAFLCVLLIGWALTLRSEKRPVFLAELNAWLALLLLGALLYSPLGWFSPFYAVPFALGSVALFARALSTLETRGPAVRWAVRSVALFILLIGAGSAANTARLETADRRIHGRLAQTIGGVAGVDSLVVAWPAVNKWAWAQKAQVIRGYAMARGYLTDAAPPAGDALCGTTRPDRGVQKRILLINYPEWCNNLPFAASELTQSYVVLSPLPELRTLRLQLAVVGPDSTSVVR